MTPEEVNNETTLYAPMFDEGYPYAIVVTSPVESLGIEVLVCSSEIINDEEN